MNKKNGFHVYLAGPEVFLNNARDIAIAKKKILALYGLTGHFPLDNSLNPRDYTSKRAFGLAIGRSNYLMMNKCDAVLANLTPWRGPSTDVGTFGECLYMFGQNKIVYGYSNDARGFAERASHDVYQGAVTMGNDGILRGADGYHIENFDLFDNLMLPDAILLSGGEFIAGDTDTSERYTGLANFEKVAQRLAARYLPA